MNTDTRGIGNITLSQEYAKLHQKFGGKPEDFFNCNRNALKATFVPDDVQKVLLAQWVDGYNEVLGAIH